MWNNSLIQVRLTLCHFSPLLRLSASFSVCFYVRSFLPRRLFPLTNNVGSIRTFIRSNDKVRIWGLIRFSWESVGTSSFPSLASFLEVSLPLRMRQDIRQESHRRERGRRNVFNSNETFFSPRRPTFKCAGDGGRVFNRRRVQLRVFSAAALASVTHVSLSGSSEIPPHSSEQK